MSTPIANQLKNQMRSTKPPREPHTGGSFLEQTIDESISDKILPLMSKPARKQVEVFDDVFVLRLRWRMKFLTCVQFFKEKMHEIEIWLWFGNIVVDFEIA